jgi:hypothetical protein
MAQHLRGTVRSETRISTINLHTEHLAVISGLPLHNATQRHGARRCVLLLNTVQESGVGKKKEKREKQPSNVTSVIQGSIRKVHKRGYNYTGVDTC